MKTRDRWPVGRIEGTLPKWFGLRRPVTVFRFFSALSQEVAAGGASAVIVVSGRVMILLPHGLSPADE